MINNYFKNNTKAYNNNLNYKWNDKFKKYQLFIKIITQAVARNLKNTFDHLHLITFRQTQLLVKVSNFSEKNINLVTFMAFNKLKIAASQQRFSEKILKNAFVLLQRIQKYKLKQYFHRLFMHCSKKDKQTLCNLYLNRGLNLSRKLKILVLTKKSSAFTKIEKWAKFIKSYSKIRVISVIFNRYQRNIKQQFFMKINRFLLDKNSKLNSHKQMSNLKLQLQDMTVQLENKNENIQRLEEEISQIKNEQSRMSFNNSYQNILNQSRTGRHKSFNNIKSSNCSQNYSIDKRSNNPNNSFDDISVGDMTLGSILGNLNKSRAGSFNKLEPNGECSCGYKAKYKKYKYLNESLKNQLDIVKEELEVSKDLNEHFTNEIKEYLSSETEDHEYEKLKKEYQIILEERDQLREKVFKYQKHINKMNIEFKAKMEGLYSKVRKNM